MTSPLRPVRLAAAAPSAGHTGEVPADPRDDLLRATARGDEQAFARLYDLVAGEVHGLVRKVLRDPAQSEEVTQEVMVQVWRTAPRFVAERGSARTWILTIAHRRAVDRVRSEQTWRDRTERAAVLEPSVPADDPADAAVGATVQHLDRVRVAAALDTLTPLQRQAIELAYVGGHTQTEIADLLDVPLGTVKTRVRDGMIRLRDQLGAAT